MTTIPPTLPADAEVAEPTAPDLMAALKGVFKALPADYERERRELPQKLLAERNALIRDAANLAAENARLRQERNEAREQAERAWTQMDGAHADGLVAARELARQRDAERERYTRLVGEVERAYEIAKDHYPWPLAGRIGAALRDALAATAPQTAPAQPTARCEYTDRDLSTGRPLRCEQPAHDGRMHRLVFADAPSEPTAADPEPVRVTGGAMLTGGVVKGEAWIPPGCDLDHYSEGTLRGLLTDALAELDRLRSARPAGDEHLQALRDERDALLTRIAEALGIAPKLAALVDESTIVDEADRVCRERDTAWAEMKRMDRALVERDEARREAERLRGEVKRIADSIPAGIATLPGLLTQLRHALDAGSSDTTAGGGETRG